MAYSPRQAIPLNASPAVARLYFVNMATGGNVNIDNTEVLAAVYNFIDGPNWSRVFNAVLLQDEEDSTVAATRQRAAGHGVGESPVRVEGYVVAMCNCIITEDIMPSIAIQRTALD